MSTWVLRDDLPNVLDLRKRSTKAGWEPPMLHARTCGCRNRWGTGDVRSEGWVYDIPADLVRAAFEVEGQLPWTPQRRVGFCEQCVCRIV